VQKVVANSHPQSKNPSATTVIFLLLVTYIDYRSLVLGDFRYVTAHLRTRNRIEKAFGVLKRRFYMLSVRVRLRLENIPQFILACFVLHNIAKEMGVPDPRRQLQDGRGNEREEEAEEGEEDFAVSFAERHFGDE
jgi:hypothetical protein